MRDLSSKFRRALTSTLFPYTTRFRSRLMRLAERFGLPVLTFVDTAGAYPGIDAEARGESEAIARAIASRSEEHTSELQSRGQLVCRLLPAKKYACNINTRGSTARAGH